VAYWSVAHRTSASVPLAGHTFEQKDSVGDARVVEQGTFEGVIEPGTVAFGPLEGMRRNEMVRKRLNVEQDLKTFLHMHVSQKRQSHYPQPEQPCSAQSELLFDEVVKESAIEKELEKRELSAFKKRFASAMHGRCKDAISELLWVEAAGQELEQQKPVMTTAIANSINDAGLGFQAKMHDWLVEESVSSFREHHLGLLPTPKGSKSVTLRPPSKLQAGELPRIFRAELKWPECREEILRVHNQGHCGSSWAFGSLASIDARMCIASSGKWDGAGDMLSRLHVTSCAPDNYSAGHDGCQGGFPHWPMEMMARTGVASTSCLPYYISGEGAQHQHTAPPCEHHCQGGYSLPLSNDTFSSAGVAKYDWIKNVHGDPTKIDMMKKAIYEEGPVAFAFAATHEFMGYSKGVFSMCTGHDQANHAVYAFGWGVAAQAEGKNPAVDYFEASNSWGPKWGMDGHFRIHARCITETTIPGKIESTVVDHSPGTVNASARDPDNEIWPWAKPEECPYSNNCITDLRGASGKYSNNELCVSKKLNGKKIKVEEFDLESGYDILSVNGFNFSGTKGGGLIRDKLNGMKVDDKGIKFRSDSSVKKAGFKLCVGGPA